jgi:hypothetical protein
MSEEVMHPLFTGEMRTVEQVKQLQYAPPRPTASIADYYHRHYFPTLPRVSKLLNSIMTNDHGGFGALPKVLLPIVTGYFDDDNVEIKRESKVAFYATRHTVLGVGGIDVHHGLVTGRSDPGNYKTSRISIFGESYGPDELWIRMKMEIVMKLAHVVFTTSPTEQYFISYDDLQRMMTISWLQFVEFQWRSLVTIELPYCSTC